MLADWMASDAKITGRRPTASESEPVKRSETRRAIAYTPKTSVSATAEKCHLAA